MGPSESKPVSSDEKGSPEIFSTGVVESYEKKNLHEDHPHT